MGLFHARIYIGALIPRVYIGALASPPGEDALPAGKDALLASEDALLTRAYIIFTLRRFFVPCFIFITQYIDNQHFQEMKHWHSMFHF